MGHAEKIHKEIYRQPLIQNGIMQISQLLEIAQATHDSRLDDEESSGDEEETVKSTQEEDWLSCETEREHILQD